MLAPCRRCSKKWRTWSCRPSGLLLCHALHLDAKVGICLCLAFVIIHAIAAGNVAITLTALHSVQGIRSWLSQAIDSSVSALARLAKQPLSDKSDSMHADHLTERRKSAFVTLAAK